MRTRLLPIDEKEIMLRLDVQDITHVEHLPNKLVADLACAKECGLSDLSEEA